MRWSANCWQLDQLSAAARRQSPTRLVTTKNVAGIDMSVRVGSTTSAHLLSPSSKVRQKCEPTTGCSPEIRLSASWPGQP